jgi:outer membrane scaffolding protein for murein synthesis (MipA/OmpV family)
MFFFSAGKTEKWSWTIHMNGVLQERVRGKIASRVFPSPVSRIAGSVDLFTRGEVLSIPRVFELSEESGTEPDLLESRGILSALMVPLRVSGKLTGFLGFDAVHEVREWSDG